MTHRTTRRRPEVPPEDPQRAVNRRWERWLARKYPGTTWEIVRIGDEDGAQDDPSGRPKLVGEAGSEGGGQGDPTEGRPGDD